MSCIPIANKLCLNQPQCNICCNSFVREYKLLSVLVRYNENNTILIIVVFQNSIHSCVLNEQHIVTYILLRVSRSYTSYSFYSLKRPWYYPSSVHSNCYVCKPKAEITLRDTLKTTVKHYLFDCQRAILTFRLTSKAS